MKHKTQVNAEAGQLMDDAHALLSATAHIAEDKVMSARKRLSAALENGREMLADVQEKAVAGAKATDHAIREYPYHAIGIAVGVGALIGLYLGRRK